MEQVEELPKVEIAEDALHKLGYHFHCFYNTFREQLVADYDNYVAEEGCEAFDYPSFCFKNFTQSFLKHHNNENNN